MTLTRGRWRAVDDGSRFFGLKKLNLHSMNADVSMLRDRLGYRMYREMDVASPRAVHARVEINGKPEGQSGRLRLVPWHLDKGFDETSDVRIYHAWTANAPCTCKPNAEDGDQSIYRRPFCQSSHRRVDRSLVGANSSARDRDRRPERRTERGRVGSSRR